MYFTNERLDRHAKDPAVVNFKGKYYLYYTVRYKDQNKIGVGIASSDDLDNWTDLGELPITRECEKVGIGAPAAIIIGSRLHLFYQTYGDFRTNAICHAWSDNGTDFEKDESNPVFRPTPDWCCGRAIDADLCLFNGRIYMYFATRDHAMRIQKIGGATASVDSGFSAGSWTQISNQSLLIPELVWEGDCIEAPATVVNDGRLFMFYGGSYNCKPQQIGVAASDDGIFFKRLFNEPFVKCGKEGSWNSSESGHPYVFRDDDGKVYLFYQGSSDMGKTWYITKCLVGFDKNNLPYVEKYDIEP
jgi:beta-1,2-mannobiose phosphorylase / 1,2-beta-oligomannan phosphorylase